MGHLLPPVATPPATLDKPHPPVATLDKLRPLVATQLLEGILSNPPLVGDMANLPPQGDTDSLPLLSRGTDSLLQVSENLN